MAVNHISLKTEFKNPGVGERRIFLSRAVSRTLFPNGFNGLSLVTRLLCGLLVLVKKTRN